MTIKRMLAALVCALLMATACCALAESTSDKGVIDLYLIAGQSNAAGYSKRKGLSGHFPNIWFAGEVDKNRLTGETALSTIKEQTIRYEVAAGLGSGTSRVGPEYGMAQVLNDHYSSEHPALIFKSAAGGTSLRNKQSGNSQVFGNWYPRSLWPAETIDPLVSATGVQYANFVGNLRWVCDYLRAEGYTIRVRGMVWMQGEDDLGAHGTYKRLLKSFITDMRKDISEITGDPEVLEMPFVIGKIATTFAMYDNPNVPAFNEMQDDVANEMTNVYTIETSDLIIVGEGGKVVGTDLYHFNTEDAVTLGNRFAEKLLKHYTAK